MAVPFRLRQLDHVVLRVRDVAKMRRFYCDVLGCTSELDQPGIGLFQLRAGASLIDLVDVDGKLGRQGGAAPGAEACNMDHFCLAVEGYDEAAIVAHLQSHGARVGDIGIRYGAEGEGPSIYVSDPEGNVVELKGPPVDSGHPALRPFGPGYAVRAAPAAQSSLRSLNRPAPDACG